MHLADLPRSIFQPSVTNELSQELNVHRACCTSVSVLWHVQLAHKTVAPLLRGTIALASVGVAIVLCLENKVAAAITVIDGIFG